MKKNFYYDSRDMKLNKKGYPIFKDSEKPLHVYVAEKYMIKRKLDRDEVVHHVNGDKLNFHPSNLAVMHYKDHMKVEKRIRTETNLNIAYGIIVVFALYLLGVNTGRWNPNINLAVGILLMIGLLIPHYPKALRRVLFILRILKKNQTKEIKN